MNVEIRNEAARSFISGNIFFEFSVQCICSVVHCRRRALVTKNVESYIMALRGFVYNPPPPPPQLHRAEPEMYTFLTSPSCSFFSID
jgi:hypothetical protein